MNFENSTLEFITVEECAPRSTVHRYCWYSSSFWVLSDTIRTICLVCAKDYESRHLERILAKRYKGPRYKFTICRKNVQFPNFHFIITKQKKRLNHLTFTYTTKVMIGVFLILLLSFEVNWLNIVWETTRSKLYFQFLDYNIKVEWVKVWSLCICFCCRLHLV